MKRIIALVLTAILTVCCLGLCACGKSKKVTVGIPNDTTNEARALRILEANGYIKLREGAGETATKKDIVENPYNLEFIEVEAAQLPKMLQDFDYAAINSNYALEAGLSVEKDALLVEGSYSTAANILAVKSGRENDPIIKALAAALASQQVKDFLATKYAGEILSVIDNPTNGYDDSIDYAALAGQTVSVAASPTPHAEILAIAKEILAEKGITLKIIEFTDYVQPNNVVEQGEVDANYFQHVPYMNDFNANNNTHIVSVLAIHVEPMGFYGGQQSTLDALKNGKTDK